MPSIDNVEDIEPRVQYEALAAQTVFAIPFQFFEDVDLVVDIDGETKVLTTDYTVDEVDGEFTGNLTLEDPLTGGEIVTIYRDIAIERTVDFQTNGPVRSTTFNDELDKITLILQQLESRIGRALRLPLNASATSASAELSPIDSWLSKYVFISADGTPEPATIVSGTLSQSVIGELLYPLSDQESAGALSASDVNTRYEYGNLLRYKADPTGVANSDLAVTRCQAAGYRVYAPRGTYLFNSTIAVKAPGFYGDGPNLTKLKFAGVDAFTLSSSEGLDRPACVIESFSVDATTSTNCAGKYFFNAPGVASLAAAVYNSGITVRDIEVGRNAKFGGGFYIKDVFRLNVERIGFTDVSHMIRLVGSVVQCSFRNVKSNNDSAATTLSRYGISTESATYSGATVLTPESIDFVDCAHIRGERGINHTAGLHIHFEKFDCESEVYGALLNAPCKLTKGILGSSPAATAWTGVFLGVSPAEHDMRVLDSVEINALNVPATPTSSYGIDAGDGVSPVRGVVIKNCMIQGATNSLQSAVRGRILNDFTLEDCGIETDVVTGANDVSITSSTGLSLRNNRNTSGVWSITDGGDAAAYGEIDKNRITTLTFTPTTRANWKLDINGAIVRRRRGVANVADGGTIAHGLSSTPTYFQATATQSGEFASVTSVSGTNLTVAIKKHDNTAGTTQNIHWEAEY
jgi:hypothetical protein